MKKLLYTLVIAITLFSSCEGQAQKNKKTENANSSINEKTPKALEPG